MEKIEGPVGDRSRTGFEFITGQYEMAYNL